MKWNRVGWKRRGMCAGAALGLMLAAAGVLGAQAGVAGSGLEAEVATSVGQLQGSVAGLQPSGWHAARADKADLEDARQSLARNLQEAVPGLLAEWNRQPRNLAAAFRLYRDLEAVYQVALRLSSSASRFSGGNDTRALAVSVEVLHQRLAALGDYIQSEAAIEYRELSGPRREAAPGGQAAAPKVLVIQDANGGPAHHTRRKAVTKKPPRRR